MPPPFPVRLLPHDPAWPARAAAEAARLRAAMPGLDAIHHIGSTAVAGLVAKPVIDLLAVAERLAVVTAARARLEALGYACHGAYGLPGRRYCTLDDPATGVRRFQLHCFAAGDPAVARHLAFRDLLRADPAVAAAYAADKRRCAALHAEDSHAYADCKHDWIARMERLALARDAP